MSAFADGLAKGTVSLQSCGDCGSWQVPDRLACSHCGSSSLVRKAASGLGTIYAVSTVCRAPDAAFQSIVPYDLVLVDLVEGPRIMGHGMPGLTIGTPVRAAVCERAGRMLLTFARRGPAPQGGNLKDGNDSR